MFDGSCKLPPASNGRIPGRELFRLQAEKGFPADLAGEVLAEQDKQVDWPDYERAQEEHRRISRVSAQRHFHLSDSHEEAASLPLD